MSVLFSSFSPGSGTVPGTENDFNKCLLNKVHRWGCHDSNSGAFSLKSCQLALDIHWGKGMGLKIQVLLYLLIEDSDLVKHRFRLRVNMWELMLCCWWEFSSLSIVTLELYCWFFPAIAHAELLQFWEQGCKRMVPRARWLHYIYRLCCCLLLVWLDNAFTETLPSLESLAKIQLHRLRRQSGPWTEFPSVPSFLLSEDASQRVPAPRVLSTHFLRSCPGIRQKPVPFLLHWVWVLSARIVLQRPFKELGLSIDIAWLGRGWWSQWQGWLQGYGRYTMW